MSKRKLIIVAVLSLFVAFAATLPSIAASYDLGWTGGETQLKTLDEICNMQVQDPNQQELRIFYVTVKCFETLIEGLAEDTMVSFSDMLRDAVTAALMLSLILFGAKVVTGMSVGERLKGDFVVTVLKIAFVSWLVLNYGMMDLWYMTLGTYDSLIGIVLNPANSSGCPLIEVNTSGVWKMMDCMFTKFMGYSQKDGSGQSQTAVALLGSILATKMFSGTDGLFVGAIVGNAILTVILAFVRICCIYLLSMIGLILMFSIAPLIIPLMLFGYTKQMFDDWWKTVLSLVMQPVIVFAFFGFIAPMIYDNIEQLVQVYNQAKFKFEVLQKDEAGTASIFQQIMTMATNAPNDDQTKEILLNLITITAMGYLILSFLNFVSEMAYELSGGGKVPKLSAYLPDAIGTGPGALRI